MFKSILSLFDKEEIAEMIKLCATVFFVAFILFATVFNAFAQQKQAQGLKKDPAIVFTPDGYVVMPREYFDNYIKQRLKDHENKLKLWKEIEDLEAAIENAKCS